MLEAALTHIYVLQSYKFSIENHCAHRYTHSTHHHMVIVRILQPYVFVHEAVIFYSIDHMRYMQYHIHKQVLNRS